MWPPSRPHPTAKNRKIEFKISNLDSWAIIMTRPRGQIFVQKARLLINNPDFCPEISIVFFQKDRF